MKIRIIFTVILLFVCLLFTSCSKKEDKNIIDINHDKSEIVEGVEEIYDGNELFYEGENVQAFCVGEDGTVYSLENGQSVINVYDTDGKSIKEYPIGEGFCQPYLSSYGNFLYYIMEDSLCELDLLSGETQLLYKFEGDDFEFGGLVAFEDTIVLIRKNQYDEEQAEVRYDETDCYDYDGETLIHFYKSRNDITMIEIPNIKLISKKNDKELLVYAYDGKKGFYFTTYHVITETIGNKMYTDMKLEHLYSIAYDDILDKVICTSSKGLLATGLESTDKQSSFYENGNSTMNGNAIQFLKGYSYYNLNIDGTNKIVRIYNTAFIKDNPIIKSYYISPIIIPDGFGYQIDAKELDESEMAKVLLAGDTDYDFAVLSSSRQLARHIRDIGAYKPLDTIDGVYELLDQCYDYIEEAAIDDKGKPWMLPVLIECPILIYNPQLYKDYDIDISSINTYKELINKVVNLPKDETILYNIPYFYMTIDITDKYLTYYAINGNKSMFNTKLFRTYTEIMSKYDEGILNGETIFGSSINFHYDPIKANGLNQREYKDFIYSKILLEMCRSSENFENYYQYDNFKATAMPGLEEGKTLKSIADCYFIIVNPNSKKIKWTEDYLARLCNAILDDSTSYMLKDTDFGNNRLRAEIQAVIADAQVLFSYPYEIINDELKAYRLEGKPLDKALSEMERKMDMYLNE